MRQIWRILRQHCSDDSTEVTEGVTLTPKIFGNKQGATSTPEIFGNKHSFVLPFFTRQNRKRVNYDQSYSMTAIMDLSFPGQRTATATSCIPHDSVYMPGPRAGKSDT